MTRSWPSTSPADLLAKLREELEMARELLPAFDRAGVPRTAR